MELYNVRPYLGDSQINYICLGDLQLKAAYLGDKLVYGNDLFYKQLTVYFYYGCVNFSQPIYNLNSAYISTLKYQYRNTQLNLISPLTTYTINTSKFKPNNTTYSDTSDMINIATINIGGVNKSYYYSTTINFVSKTNKFYFKVDNADMHYVEDGHYGYIYYSTDEATTSEFSYNYFVNKKLSNTTAEVVADNIAFLNVTNVDKLYIYGLTDRKERESVGPGPSTGYTIRVHVFDIGKTWDTGNAVYASGIRLQDRDLYTQSISTPIYNGATDKLEGYNVYLNTGPITINIYYNSNNIKETFTFEITKFNTSTNKPVSPGIIGGLSTSIATKEFTLNNTYVESYGVRTIECNVNSGQRYYYAYKNGLLKPPTIADSAHYIFDTFENNHLDINLGFAVGTYVLNPGL